MLSPTDNEEAVRAKIANYLAAGTTVWLFNPLNRSVHLYAPGQRVIRLTQADVLDAAPLVPGFRLVLADIFPQEAEDDE